MSDNPIPFSEWAKRVEAHLEEYPTKHVLYGWTRPSSIRDELVGAGVIARINGRWLFNPPKWREHCASQFRSR